MSPFDWRWWRLGWKRPDPYGGRLICYGWTHIAFGLFVRNPWGAKP